MNVTQSIHTLLYQYDCVIVPGFGGFVTHHKGAHFNPISYEFKSPTKQLAFNPDLKVTDGLLVNSMAKTYNVSYEKASEWLEEIVNGWKRELLETGNLVLPGLGSFKTIQGKWEFIPEFGLNFSMNHYGLVPVKATYISRGNVINTPKQKTSHWPSYAAAVAFALIVGSGSFFANHSVVQNQLSTVLPFLKMEMGNSEMAPENANTEDKKEAKVIFESIDTEPEEIATVEENIEVNAQPESLNESVAKDEIETEIVKPELEEHPFEKPVKNYQVIGGSFKNYARAMSHVKELHRKGFKDATIIGKVGKYYMVSINSYNDREQALEKKRELEQLGYDVFLRP